MIKVNIDQWPMIQLMSKLKQNLKNLAHPTMYPSWFKAWWTRAIVGRRMYVGKNHVLMVFTATVKTDFHIVFGA